MSNFLKDTPAFQIGVGYSTDQQIPVIEQCINISNIIYAGGDKSTVNMGSNQQFSQIQNLLGVFTDIALFSNDQASMFAAAVQDNMYTQTFYFYSQVVLPTQILIPTAYGINALYPVGQGNYNESLAQFRSVCGDQFIGQVHMGAALFVAFQVVFATLQDKETYSSSMSSSGFAGLFDTSTTVQQTITHYNLAGTINLIAYQYGGNPSDLGQIFAQSSNGHYIISCSISNLAACDAAVNGVLNYAATNFPLQVNYTGSGISGNAAPIDYTFYPFTILGLQPSETILTQDIIEAREELAQLYLEFSEQEVFVGHILNSMIAKYMSQTTLSYMQGVYSSLQANVQLLNDQSAGAITCYTNPDNCVSTQQSIIAQLKSVDNNFINSFTLAYQLSYSTSMLMCQVTTESIDGIALPVGNGNYIKIQPNGFVESLTVNNVGQNLIINEPNVNLGVIGNGGTSNLSFNLSQTMDQVYSGEFVHLGACPIIGCTAVIIDNPL